MYRTYTYTPYVRIHSALCDRGFGRVCGAAWVLPDVGVVGDAADCLRNERNRHAKRVARSCLLKRKYAFAFVRRWLTSLLLCLGIAGVRRRQRALMSRQHRRRLARWRKRDGGGEVAAKLSIAPNILCVTCADTRSLFFFFALS